MFSRATSMPAATVSASRSGLDDAGPKVATILARRLMLIAFRDEAPELVYTTVRAMFWPAETCYGTFTERSSDVTGRHARAIRPLRAGSRSRNGVLMPAPA